MACMNHHLNVQFLNLQDLPIMCGNIHLINPRDKNYCITTELHKLHNTWEHQKWNILYPTSLSLEERVFPNAFWSGSMDLQIDRGLQGTLEVISCNMLAQVGTPSAVAQDHIQMGFEYLHG